MICYISTHIINRIIIIIIIIISAGALVENFSTAFGEDKVPYISDIYIYNIMKLPVQ